MQGCKFHSFSNSLPVCKSRRCCQKQYIAINFYSRLWLHTSDCIYLTKSKSCNSLDWRSDGGRSGTTWFITRTNTKDGQLQHCSFTVRMLLVLNSSVSLHFCHLRLRHPVGALSCQNVAVDEDECFNQLGYCSGGWGCERQRHVSWMIPPNTAATARWKTRGPLLTNDDPAGVELSPHLWRVSSKPAVEFWDLSLASFCS